MEEMGLRRTWLAWAWGGPGWLGQNKEASVNWGHCTGWGESLGHSAQGGQKWSVKKVWKRELSQSTCFCCLFFQALTSLGGYFPVCTPSPWSQVGWTDPLCPAFPGVSVPCLLHDSPKEERSEQLAFLFLPPAQWSLAMSRAASLLTVTSHPPWVRRHAGTGPSVADPDILGQ